MLHVYSRFLNRARPIILAALSCSQLLAAPAFADAPTAAWVQLTPAGAEARAVVSGACPDISLDHQQVPMQERAAPDGEFTDRVCFIELPPGLRQIDLEGMSLPVPQPDPKRIAIVGDTGCRLSDKHGLFQACNNDTVWPFAHVASAVAAAQPELIIYTGDYIYRESPCPDGNNGCKDSPYGDNEATWLADWLLPSLPIHSAAPLLLIRGNHETCSRAGDGWFRYLDARPYSGGCENLTDPWVAPVGRVQIGVIDTANLQDSEGNDLTDYFAAQLLYLQGVLRGNSWLATHQPFWGVGADDDTGELITPSEVLQEAVELAGLPAGTSLMIAAHIHLAEALVFEGSRPPSLIVANGGTELVNRVTAPDEVDGEAIKQIMMFYQFGFATMDRMGQSGWRVNFRDVDGRSITQCKLKGKTLGCEEADTSSLSPGKR